jgi:excisionase family DNA binding protein
MPTVQRTPAERAARQSLDEPMFSVAESALALNVSESTVRRMIRTGELRAIRLGVESGRTVRVPASSIREATSRPAAEELEA